MQTVDRWTTLRHAVLNKNCNPTLYLQHHISKPNTHSQQLISHTSISATPKALHPNQLATIPFVLPNSLRKVYFTKREAEVILLTLKGLTNQEMGLQLSLSARTVEYYIKNMRKKTDTHSKRQLINLMKKLRIDDYFGNITSNMKM